MKDAWKDFCEDFSCIRFTIISYNLSLPVNYSNYSVNAWKLLELES